MVDPEIAHEREDADELVPRPFILAHQLGVERQDLDESLEHSEAEEDVRHE
jgi:hypothetical protein